MGTQLQPPKRGTAGPHFSAHVYCSQTAGWIKIPLGTEVGLVPSDTVLDRDPSPHGKGHSIPHFSAHVYCGMQTVAHLSNCCELLFYCVDRRPGGADSWTRRLRMDSDDLLVATHRPHVSRLVMRLPQGCKSRLRRWSTCCSAVAYPGFHSGGTNLTKF